jgi:hypothetical protein
MALAEKKFEVVNAWETNATDDPLPAFAILPRLRITIVRSIRRRVNAPVPAVGGFGQNPGLSSSDLHGQPFDDIHLARIRPIRHRWGVGQSLRSHDQFRCKHG